MTVSFHQRTTPDFFPHKTGLVEYVVSGEGLYRTLNVPMKEGMDDDGYHRMFRPIMTKVMAVFQPETVVMQCGADSLSGDSLGQLNLSIAGHAQCVGFMRGFNVPLLLLGGGGYTVNHVTACWCDETAVTVGKEIGNDIPSHWYDRHYEGQDYKLHYPVQTDCKNNKGDTYMTTTTNTVLEHLSKLEAVPSVQFADPEGGSIDAEELFDDSPPKQESDPLERLQRQYEERDMIGFLVSLGKRQRSLDRGTETVLHRVEAVKKNGIRKARSQML
jgi:histone deacetylase 1/2